MTYSETRIVIGALAHVSVLISIANFIKGNFRIKTEEAIDTVVREEPVKVIEVKDTIVKEGKEEAIKEISNKLYSIEYKADGVSEKAKKKMITKLRSYQASIYLELGLYLSYLHLRDLYKIQFQLEFFSCKLL